MSLPFISHRKRKSLSESMTPNDQDFPTDPLISSGIEQIKFKRKVILLTLLGVQAIVCIVKIALSIWWKHWFGLGLSLCTAILTIVAAYMVWNSKGPIILKATILIVDILVISFILLLIGVVSVGRDFPISKFPNGCRRTTNCCRLTTNTSANVQADGLEVLSFNTSFESAHNLIVEWIQAQSSTTITIEQTTFLHSRFVTFLWGFPDDFYIQLECNQDGVSIWVQSESRIGIGDMNVNRNRVEKFLNYMKTQKLSTATCA